MNTHSIIVVQHACKVSTLEVVLDFVRLHRCGDKLVEVDGRYFVAGRDITAPIIACHEALGAEAPTAAAIDALSAGIDAVVNAAANEVN
jgi:hypothetical protein